LICQRISNRRSKYCYVGFIFVQEISCKKEN
jgi:hypothetical protein